MEDRNIEHIDIKKIVLSEMNPRIGIDETSLEELADSIRNMGVLSPIIVRAKNGKYEVIAGERRYRASKKAGLSVIPAIVVDITDDEALEIMLVENAQREDLNDVEKGRTCIRILEHFPENYPNERSLAEKLGVTSATIRAWISVARDVPEEIQEMIATQEKRGDPIPKGSISSQIALQITKSVKGDERRIEVAKEFAEKAIPVHKARKVMKEIVKEKEEPVKDVVERVLTKPPDLTFRLKHASDILHGKKTQTSRFFRPDELENLSEGTIVEANIWEPVFAKLRVKQIKKKRLGDFTEADAQREGGYTLEEFKDVWESIHGIGSWKENREVVVVLYQLEEFGDEIRQYLD